MALPPVDLVERGLGRHVPERVGPVAEPVGPRREHLAPAAVAPLLGAEALRRRPGRPTVKRPQGGPHLGDDGPLVAVPDDPLVAGGGGGLGGTLVGRRAWVRCMGSSGVLGRVGARAADRGAGVPGAAAGGRTRCRRAGARRRCRPVW